MTVYTGTWAGGDAAGIIYTNSAAAGFVAETISISGGASNVATIAAGFLDCIVSPLILDEDDMASDSDKSLATQQSIKAYVDNEVLWDKAGSVISPKAAGDSVNTAEHYEVDSVQVVSNRITGWTAPSGTPDRTGYNADGPPTLTEVAQALKALIDDLMTHGIIGA